jgi:sterol desaturase/sphingolipid hydroxylase (fatty acid hydroxylase superfamily)
LLCFLAACGLVAVAGSHHLQHFADEHRNAPIYVLLFLILAIPSSVSSMISAYVLEGLFVGWRRSSFRKLRDSSGSVRLDLFCVTLELLSLRRLSFVLSLGILYLIETNSHAATFVPATYAAAIAGLVGFVCLHSLASYWVHRLEHAVPVLWSLHKFHHSADRMTILTAHRQTDLTKSVEQFLEVFPFVFLAVLSEPRLGVDASNPFLALALIYTLWRTFVRVNQYLVHSNLTTDYGWIGRWLLVSPRMHRLHHARDVRYHDKNFTFDLVLWDRIFGTYASCEGAELDAVPLGVDENPFNIGPGLPSVLRDYFVTPYYSLWVALRSGLRAWLPVFSRPSSA